MGAATTVAVARAFVPGVEFVQITGSTGDTYASTKFARVIGGVASYNSAISTTTTDNMALVVTPSTTANTVTITGRGFAGEQIGLVLWGLKHNK